MKIDIGKSSFAFPDYVFREAIPNPIPYKDFQEKSLEQISAEYGKEEATLVY